MLGSRPRCAFDRSPEADPILWVSKNVGRGTMKLNGVLLRLEATGERKAAVRHLAAPGVTMTVRPLGDEADWRADAELVFALERGLAVGYRGFWACES